MPSLLRHCRSHIAYAAVFSLFINLLFLTIPLYMLQVYDRVLASRSHETLFMLTLLAIAGLALHMALEALRSRLMLAAGVVLDDVAAPVVLEETFKDAAKPGANAYAAGVRDVATLRGFLTGPSINALFDAPWLPLYVLVIFAFHWWLGMIAAIGALLLFGIALCNEKLTRKPLDTMSEDARHAGRYIDACARNAEVANALGMIGNLTSRWRQLNDQVIDALVATGRSATWLGPVSKFVRLAIQVAMLAAGALLVIDQEMTAGVMITGTLILARALAPVESAIATWKGFVEARDASRRIGKLLRDVPAVDPTLELPAPQGKLEVERAVFALPGAERAILKGISFKLEPGESLGIIGQSASGKSTLARLIIGLWRASAGIVRLDGADIARWPREQLGPHLGYLPQDVELFSGTVAQNIARFEEATSEAVIEAARAAHAHDMILRLPKGYDTEVGEAGAVLSGGQRQRIGLARALYGNPRMVVLDEPNANLDSEAECALLKAMDELKQRGVTLLAISHRPSLLAHVDKLLVLKEGQTEHFGPRAEVMARVTRKSEATHGVRFPQLVQGGVSA